MSIIRECILNEVKMALVRIDHKGIPQESAPDEDPRDTLIMMAALDIFAIEELDTKRLGDAV